MKKQYKYINSYNKTHYKEYRILLKPEDFEIVEQERQKTGLSRPKFLMRLLGFKA